MLGVGMSNRARAALRIGAGSAAIVGVWSAAPPAQASFFAVAEAPAGNSADPANPGRDLTAAGIGYNRTTGLLRAAVQFAGPPTADEAFVGIFVGTRGPGGCNVYPAVGITSFSFGGDARWARVDGPGGVTAGNASAKGRGETTQTFEAQDRRLEGVTPNCAIATLTAPGDAKVVYDAIGPIDLVAQAELAAKFAGVPEPFVTGRSRQVSVIVRNVGDADSGKQRLRIRSERGVTVKPSVVTVGSIKPGAKRTVKVRVTPSRKAKPFTDLTAIVGKAPLEAQAKTKVWHRAARKPSSGGGGGGRGGSQVCNRWLPDISGETGGSLALVPC